MKLIVPAYFDPGPKWDTVLGSNLDKIGGVIINPNSGPGDFNPEYQALCTRLRKAGVRPMGYVSTDYGKRPTAAILSDIEVYASRYGVCDIFLDEAHSGEEMVSFYGDLYREINGRVVLNHGVVPDKGYLEVGDELMVFESELTKLRGLKMPAWVMANRAKMSAIVLNCPAKDMPFALTKVSAWARSCYITDDKGHFDRLPKYWNELLKAVK